MHTSNSEARRQLAAGLQLDRTHMLSRIAIAADEYDNGNVLGSEVHLVDALHALRSLRLQVRSRCELNGRALMSQTSATRILVLTNIAVLHQRCGEHKSAEDRYKQIKDLSPHLLGNHIDLLTHVCWCEATNTLAVLLNSKRNMRDVSFDLGTNGEESCRVLQYIIKVLN